MEMEESKNTKVLSFVIGRMITERRISGARRLTQFRTNLRSKLALGFVYESLKFQIKVCVFYFVGNEEPMKDAEH